MTLKALLIDIDGTLMFKGQALPGADHMLHTLQHAGLKVRLLTNISARSTADIAQELNDAGISVCPAMIQTAGVACAQHVHARPGASCHLLVPQAMEALFDQIPRSDQSPDFVVIGDIGERFDYRCLNQAFRLIRAGATLLAPHRNLYWHSCEGPMLDAGAFIQGLEAATGREALVTGKPSPLFFQGALDALGVTAAEAMVVGDDLRTDGAGARALGMAYVQVATGKGLDTVPDLPPARHRIPSIAALLDHLNSLPTREA
ncbi:HAD-IIA family hydrolase [Roseateles sp. SL47]|uniref:HAD-IIA family hydrolase n=1 Tax=Roseateles sp. SL47 TaxID=2995138 RepID=UPI002271F60E|nr:HAD-IIA family hydrolase [Roseateles sp. SL47]WAC71679.1 HAD-IIA family hydrolase [Roseateles sp. SL47]